MNVYIVPTPAIPRGFDKRLVSSWRRVPGVGSFSLASDSRLPGASQRRQHLRSGRQLCGKRRAPATFWLRPQDGGRPPGGCSGRLGWNGSAAILWHRFWCRLLANAALSLTFQPPAPLQLSPPPPPPPAFSLRKSLRTLCWVLARAALEFSMENSRPCAPA